MPYTVGISSGWWNIGHASALLGVGMKVMSVATWGANFVQVDFENTSEFLEPEVVNQIKKAREDLNIRWGSHGEIGEYMAWDAALETIWKHSHRRLHQYLNNLHYFFSKTGNAKYKPEYINFHASNLSTIGMQIEKFRYLGLITVTLDGDTNWDKFLGKESEIELKKWFQENLLLNILSSEFAHPGTREEIMTLPFRGLSTVYSTGKYLALYGKVVLSPEVLSTIKEHLSRKQIRATDEEIRNRKLDPLTLEEVDKIVVSIVLNGKISNDVKWDILDIIYDYTLRAGSTREGSGIISQEERAYLLIARYLFIHRNDPKEPLWKLFFGNKTWDDLEKSWFKDGNKKIFDVESGRIQLMPELVAMVACRYIIGHFTAKPSEEDLVELRNKLGKEYEIWYEQPAIQKLNDLNKSSSDNQKTFFTFENPEILQDQREGLQRVSHAKHIYNLIKAFEAAGTQFTRIFFDSEHYLHNGFDPIAEIKSAPEDFGNFVLAYHIGAPKPYHPVHEPIDIGSEAQRWIYKYAWELRQKGFGVKDNAFLIFERGGARSEQGQNPAQFIAQSAAALKLIADQLEKNTEPDKLPLEFYGISSTGFLSEDRQLATIKEHFFDPLKGTLSVPEEEHTFLGGEYLKKPGAQVEKWKKEELR